jgi:hypothetical protein
MVSKSKMENPSRQPYLNGERSMKRKSQVLGGVAESRSIAVDTAKPAAQIVQDEGKPADLGNSHCVDALIKVKKMNVKNLKIDAEQARKMPPPAPRARRPGFAMSQPLRPALPASAPPMDRTDASSYMGTQEFPIKSYSIPNAGSTMKEGHVSAGAGLPSAAPRPMGLGNVAYEPMFPGAPTSLLMPVEYDTEASVNDWRSYHPHSVRVAYTSPTKPAASYYLYHPGQWGQPSAEQGSWETSGFSSLHVPQRDPKPKFNLKAVTEAAKISQEISDSITKRQYQTWKRAHQDAPCGDRGIDMKGVVAACVALVAIISLGPDGAAAAGVDVEKLELKDKDE